MQAYCYFNFTANSQVFFYDNITEYKPVDTLISSIIKELQDAGYTDVQYRGFEYSKHADGGYPLYYITEDNACLCPDCANENKALTISDDAQWKIIAMDANYEDTSLYCDHCSKQIPSAYGEDIAGEDQ